MARVVPPVPGPSSTTMRERAMPAASTTRRSRKRELGMTEPIMAGSPKESAKEREMAVAE